jgi:hypothetical protein
MAEMQNVTSKTGSERAYGMQSALSRLTQPGGASCCVRRTRGRPDKAEVWTVREPSQRQISHPCQTFPELWLLTNSCDNSVYKCLLLYFAVCVCMCVCECVCVCLFCFCFCFWDTVSLGSPRLVTKIMIFLLLPPVCWYYRCVPPHLAHSVSYN